MLPPKSVAENNAVMSEEIKQEKGDVMRSALWNEKISSVEANLLIDAFNKKWISAGGVKSSTIINRK